MPKRPNILLFMADQLRYDCVGYAGRRPVRTPNLDRLAAEGAAFTNCYVPTPVCAPARQSFLTGRRAESFGALWNYGFVKTPTVMPQDDTFLRRLNDAGYGCSVVGSWEGSVEPAEKFGAANAWNLGVYGDYIRSKYPDVQYRSGWFGEHSPIPAEDSRPFWCADRAAEEIRRIRAEGKPFFVWVDGVDPHLPCRPSSPYYEMYDPAAIPPWDSFGDTLENKPYIQRQQLYNWRVENRTWAEWSKTVACCFGMITQLDAAFGRILAALDELGCAEDTLVVFTSDHGDLCGGHGMMDKHYVMYDDVIRVPLVMRLPGTVRAGTRPEAYVSNALDWAATLGEMLDFSMPGCQGKSLLPLCRGEEQPRNPWAVSSYSGMQFGLYTQRGIRTDRWKYVWNLTDTDELYDLAADPGEKTNRIAEPELAPVAADLRRKMKAELLRCGDPYAKVGWLSRQLDENVKLTSRP